MELLLWYSKKPACGSMRALMSTTNQAGTDTIWMYQVASSPEQPDYRLCQPKLTCVIWRLIFFTPVRLIAYSLAAIVNLVNDFFKFYLENLPLKLIIFIAV